MNHKKPARKPKSSDYIGEKLDFIFYFHKVSIIIVFPFNREKIKILDMKTFQKSTNTAYTVKKSLFIEEMQCTITELIHDHTGAKITHIGNEDKENAFCLSFQTTPKDSSGVAHILEHAILCGSKKFPVKDPFFSMIRRSLNTFMNAWTGSDFTAYPAASQIKKDFYNLLDVYTDSVFNPLLTRQSFLQEGHRLEFSDPQDIQSSLTFKGIVFNEMKGALASPEERLQEELNKALFPTLTYGINSGGDPKNIVNLTYEDFLQFHKTYYHPSRCHFFFYGNLPLEGHLEFLDKNVFPQTEKMEPLPPIPKEKRLTSPLSKTVFYPFPKEEKEDNSCYCSLGYLTCTIDNQEEIFALYILEILLMGTDASPLKSRLLSSPLCQQVSMYMQDEYSEIPLIITFKGCPQDSQHALQELLTRSLKEVIDKDFTMQEIENALHQFTFHRSEISQSSYPFGLVLFMRTILPAQHGVAPEKGMLIASIVQTLRAKLHTTPSYFIDLIKKHILENTHAVSLFMAPDKELSDKENALEKSVLDTIHSSLSLEEKKALATQAEELEKLQEEQEEEKIECLPKVQIKDIPLETTDYPISQEKKGNLHLYSHTCFTNHITYLDLYFTLPPLNEQETLFLPLIAHFLPQVGWNHRSYVDNLSLLQENTGGIGVALSFHQNSENPLDFTLFMAFQGKSLDYKVDKLTTLLQDMAQTASFLDIRRMRELIEKLHTSLKTELNSHALHYASSLSASYTSAQSHLKNTFSGLPFFYFVEKLAKMDEEAFKEAIHTLEKIKDKILCKNRADLVISTDAHTFTRLEKNNFYNLPQLPITPSLAFKTTFHPKITTPQGRIISSPVAFTSKSLRTVGYESLTAAAALSTAAPLMNSTCLHRMIREKGGAYGGGASYNPLSGNFKFYGYRDPHIAKTLKAFEQATSLI
jgi:presequence protease